MKKNYLMLSLSFGMISGCLFAQNAYITGNAKVKVESKTLVYFGDDFRIESGVSQAKTIENAGNIKIDGEFHNEATALDNKAKAGVFVSTWTDADNYGQVIINDANVTSGFLAMEKGSIDPDIFPWGQFSIPFSFNTTNEAFDYLFDIVYQDLSRYKSPMMRWHNLKFRYDHLSSTTSLAPTDYVILNLDHVPAGLSSLMTGNAKLQYSGKPTNGTYSVTYDGANFPSTNWTVWGNQQNYYSEKYKTYITDPIRSLPADEATYGKYLYQLGNPYTSNLDLREANLIGVKGVIKYTEFDWEQSTGVATAIAQKATYAANVWAGDKEAVIIKPFEPFQIAYEDADTYTFTFTDDLKTFKTANELSEDINGVITGRANTTANLSLNQNVNSNTGINSDFHQVSLSLYSTDGEALANRVFVAVTSVAENAVPNNLEAEYYDFDDRTGFYLGQEKEDGGIVRTSTRKMDINTINPDFINKSIPLFFNRATGDSQGYYVKADLFYGSIFNQLGDSETNFSNGNSFYFYDSKNNTFIPVTTDFNYYVEPENIYGAKTRYELYWNGAPSLVGSNNLNYMETDMSGTTYVFKHNTVHKVRFNETWSKADVNVYDIYGMNILSYSNVDTTSDLTLDLQRGVYFVRIEANTGELHVQKIIK